MKLTTTTTNRAGRAFRNRTAAFLLATLTGAASLVAGVHPVSAAGTPKYCWHDSKPTTLIDVGLPLTYTSGITADFYVQRWNGYDWYYMKTSQGQYVMQRFYSTLQGYWSNQAGNYVNDAPFYLAVGTGYYRLVNHTYYSTNPSGTGYTPVSGYWDNLRGTTDWCYA